MHHLSGGICTVVIAYTCFLLSHRAIEGALDLHEVFGKLLWMLLQILATIAIHMVTSAIGEVYANSSVYAVERNDATAS